MIKAVFTLNRLWKWRKRSVWPFLKFYYQSLTYQPEAMTTTYVHNGTVKVGLSTDTDPGGTVTNNPALAHKRVGVAWWLQYLNFTTPC